MSTDTSTRAHVATPVRAPRPLRAIGDRVLTREGTGTVVDGSVWTYNVEHGSDPGDRVVSMDATGERLVFERYLMDDAPAEPVTDATGAVLAAHDVVSCPNGDTLHVTAAVPSRHGAPAIVRGRVTGGAYHGLAVTVLARTVTRTGASWAPVPVLTGSPEWAARHEQLATRSAYDHIMGAIVNGVIGAVHATVGYGVR